MLVAFPFSRRDQSLALANLQWMAELGHVEQHDIILFVDDDVDARAELAVAKSAFKSAKICPVDKCPTEKWPLSQNHVFRRIVDFVDHFKLYPFYLNESDAIPLYPEWLNDIAKDWQVAAREGKHFMGYLEYKGDPQRQHMNGVAVYDDVYKYAPALISAPTEDNGKNYMAFDWAGGPEVVPQMRVSRLIQFAYKKEAELLKDTTLSWLNPDAAVFHTCKDLRIFDLLRARNNGTLLNTLKTKTDEWLAGKIKEAQAVPIDATWKSLETTILSPLTCDIFIKTYNKVADWHGYAMASIEKFATGFRKTIVVGEQPVESYAAMQVHKLNADKYTDADYILTTDSDCVFSTPVTPRTFMRNGKTIWLHRSWEAAVAQEGDAVLRWKVGMANFMGVEPHREFMCRHPEILPRWIYAAFRMFCFEKHGNTLDEWILGDKDFADWNVLGFYAWTFHRSAFTWIDQDREEPPPMTLKQFWGGHEPIEPRRAEIEALIAGGVEVKHAPPGPIERTIIPPAIHQNVGETKTQRIPKRGKKMKRTMSPEHKAKVVAALAKARAAKLAKA